MAKGLDAINKIAEANKKEFDGEFITQLWPALKNDGDSVDVRFLEDSTEFEGAYFHMVQRPGSKMFDRYLCLDQENIDPESCPGCVAGTPKSFKGFINVIWYDAPQIERDADGKGVKNAKGEYNIVGTADVNAVWIQGITVFRQLGTLDSAVKGLKNLDFRIVRSGSGKSTAYNIIPLVGEEREFDPELLETKYDLTQFTEATDLDKMNQVFLNAQYEQPEANEAGKSPFRRKNRFE